MGVTVLKIKMLTVTKNGGFLHDRASSLGDSVHLPPGDIWQCLEKYLIVMTGEDGGMCYWPQTLLNILQ